MTKEKPREQLVHKGVCSKTFTLLTLLGLLCLALFLGAPPASAHAQLVASYPSDGSSVQASPQQIVLSWGEDVRTKSNQFSLINSTGKRIATTSDYIFDKSTQEGTASITPSVALPKGSYLLSWKVISHDGHLVGGTISFGVETPAVQGSNAPLTSYPEQGLQIIFWVLLILIFGAIFAGRMKSVAILAWLGIFAALLRVANSFLILQKSFLDLGSTKISIAAIVILLIIIGLSRSATRRVLQKFGINQDGDLKIYLLILLSILFSSQAFFEGHALDLEKQGYLKYISALHLLFALLWSGSVVAFILNRTKEQYEVTRKISTVSVIFIIIFGGTLTYFLVRPLKFANKTAWLTFLVIKLAFVFATLALGAFHHFKGRQYLEANELPFKRTLTLELLTIVGVVASTTLMVSYTPPKVIANQFYITSKVNTSTVSDGYIQTPIKFNDGMTGTLYLQKTKVGAPAMIMLALNSKTILKAKFADIYFSNSSLNIVDLHVKLTGGTNQYMAYVTLPSSGIWRVTLQIMVDEFTQLQSSLNLKI